MKSFLSLVLVFGLVGIGMSEPPHPNHGPDVPHVMLHKEMFEEHLRDMNDAIENLFTSKPYEKVVLQYGHVKFPFKDFTEHQRNMYYIGNAEQVTKDLTRLAHGWGQIYINFDTFKTVNSVSKEDLKEDLKEYIVKLKAKRIEFATKFEIHVGTTVNSGNDEKFLTKYLVELKKFHSRENLHEQQEG